MPEQQKSKPKILLYDLETAPMQAWVWSLWKENIGINQIVQPGRIICWAAKFLDSKEVYTGAEWQEDPAEMIHRLHSLIEEADVTVAHFGDRFDKPTMNMEFLRHGLNPPAPSRSVDTWKVASSTFKLASNKLDYLGEFLGVGRKLPTTFELWSDCLNGDPKAQKKMLEYNVQDLKLLERVYLRLRPWIKNHPNLSLYAEGTACPNCGSSKLQRRGYSYTQVAKYQRFQCTACGSWSRTRFTEVDVENRKAIITQDKS